MVGHHKINTPFTQVGNLIASSDAVVDGNHERRRTRLHHAIERRLRKAVPLFKAVRNKGVHLRPQRAKRLGKQACGGDAVHVEVTKNSNGFAVYERRLYTIGDFAHARDVERVAPIALKRGCKKPVAIRNRADAMCHHDARHKRFDPQALGKLIGERGILRRHRPTACGLKRRHGTPPLQALRRA